MYKITASVHFDAAHYLKDYPGKCAEIHGHRWVVGIQISGEELNEIGILIDFNDIKQYLREVTEKLDHRLINEVQPFDRINPTAENMARYIYESVKEKLSKDFPGLKIDFVEVCETPQAKAVYQER